MNSNKPKLSVLLSAYNAESFIQECIESILNQSFQDFELLIADDFSTDRTRLIIDRYISHPLLRVHHNSKNQGKVNTINHLLAKAKGKYITVHDADDYSHPERFTKQIDFMESNPDLALIGCNFYQISEEGQELVKSNLTLDHQTISARIHEVSQFHGPTVVFKRSIVEECGGLYRQFFIVAEDIDFTIRVTEKFKTANLKDHLYYYRIHGDSLTKRIDLYTIRRYALRDFRKEMARQRAETGKDVLWNNENLEEAEKLYNACVEQWKGREFEVLSDGISRSLSFGIHKTAFLLCLKMIYKFPFQLKSYRTLFYVWRKWIINLLS